MYEVVITIDIQVARIACQRAVTCISPYNARCQQHCTISKRPATQQADEPVLGRWGPIIVSQLICTFIIRIVAAALGKQDIYILEDFEHDGTVAKLGRLQRRSCCETIQHQSRVAHHVPLETRVSMEMWHLANRNRFARYPISRSVLWVQSNRP